MRIETNLKPEQVTEGMRLYRAYGGAERMLYEQSTEVLLDGPAGTGKSRGVLEKLFLLLHYWPNSRGLLVRKTRASLTETGLVTLEDKVLPAGHPAIRRGLTRGNRTHYEIGDDSELILAGMDKPSKILSAEFDLICVQQAEELTLTDWETLTTRLRNGKIPFQQIFGDCNPGPPTHWIKQRESSGVLKLIPSRHEDNPVLWDHTTGTWTNAGVSYIAVLDKLTGPRKERLRHGRWVGAEGVVYEAFDTALHLIDRFEIPREWRRIRVIDFGYTNPFVCFDDQTEILTPTGWVNFANLDRDSSVATVNPSSKSLEWQKPTAYIEQWYEGPLVTAESDRLGANFAVTPNHQMLVGNRKSNRWRFERADRLIELGDSVIPTGWNPLHGDDGSTPYELSYTNSKGRKSSVSTTRAAFARFVGLWIAEGCLYEQTVKASGEVRKFVRIAQKYDLEAVRSAISGLGVKWTEHTNANGVVDFRIRNIALYQHLYELCGKVESAQKRIPSAILEWGADSLRELLAGLIQGDGRHKTHDSSGRRVASDAYFTTSAKLADDVQSLACRLGIPSIINDSVEETPFSLGPVAVYTVRFHQTRQALIGKLPLAERHYSGYVRCVTVPNGILVVRRGGRPMLCGNCQWWAIDPDGRMYMYREIYHTQRLVQDHARQILALSRNERIEATIADHDAEDRATLHYAGIGTIPAWKSVSDGIQAVQARLQKDGTGKPRMFFLRDSLVERDASLAEAAKPTCTVEEFDGYIWAPSTDGKPVKDEPLKVNDHGCDNVRYSTSYVDNLSFGGMAVTADDIMTIAR